MIKKLLEYSTVFCVLRVASIIVADTFRNPPPFYRCYFEGLRNYGLRASLFSHIILLLDPNYSFSAISGIFRLCFTNKILVYVSSISEKVGRISAISNLESKPHLRRNKVNSFFAEDRSQFSFFGAGKGCNQWQDCGIQQCLESGNPCLNIFP